MNIILHFAIVCTASNINVNTEYIVYTFKCIGDLLTDIGGPCGGRNPLSEGGCASFFPREGANILLARRGRQASVAGCVKFSSKLR